MNNIEPLLKDIGMKEYEAKAFAVILQQCRLCSAEQLSRLARIPLTRVYETMGSLQKQGLVTALNTRPKKYRLISIDALSNIIEEKKRLHQHDIDRSEAIIKQIKHAVPKTVPKHADDIRKDFWVFEGRETAIRKITEEEKKSTKEMLIFSDDFSWFPRFRKVLKSKINNGVTVKVLIDLDEKTSGTVKELLKIGADVRGWDVKSLSGDIIDNNMTHMISKIPRAGVNINNHYGRPGTEELFVYNCLATSNPIMVRMVKTYFDVFWWRGERPRVSNNAKQEKGSR